MTFPACALHQLFVRSCDLAHHDLYCSLVCAYTHDSSLRLLLFGVCLRCFLVLTWKNLSACGCLLAPLSGISLTTWPIRSQHHILSNSYKLVLAPRPLCRCRPPHESHMMHRLQVSVSYPQATLSATHPQVRMDPTRTTTNDLLSATLAEAATQLSFTAFLERCIFVNASPPPQLPVPTPFLDAATQTIPHIAVSQDVSTQVSFMGVLS